jgi:hypothetical protein
MSCDLALAAYLVLASVQPGTAPAAVPAAPLSVAAEPLFADIVRRAGRLRTEAEGYRTPALKAAAAPAPLSRFDRFRAGVGELAALDMKGNEELARRGTDGDLKCILKGIAQDLAAKLRQLAQAPNGAAQDLALRDMGYLLRDNVEVITAPPAPPV